MHTIGRIEIASEGISNTHSGAKLHEALGTFHGLVLREKAATITFHNGDGGSLSIRFGYDSKRKYFALQVEGLSDGSFQKPEGWKPIACQMPKNADISWALGRFLAQQHTHLLLKVKLDEKTTCQVCLLHLNGELHLAWNCLA